MAEIEGQRQRAVSVEELLGLAYVFDVSVKRLLGATFHAPPSRAKENRLQVTPDWALDRSEVLALLSVGRRKSALDLAKVRADELREQLAQFAKQRRHLQETARAVAVELESLRSRLENEEQ